MGPKVRAGLQVRTATFVRLINLLTNVIKNDVFMGTVNHRSTFKISGNRLWLAHKVPFSRKLRLLCKATLSCPYLLKSYNAARDFWNSAPKRMSVHVFTSLATNQPFAATFELSVATSKLREGPHPQTNNPSQCLMPRGSLGIKQNTGFPRKNRIYIRDSVDFRNPS